MSMRHYPWARQAMRLLKYAQDARDAMTLLGWSIDSEGFVRDESGSVVPTEHVIFMLVKGIEVDREDFGET